MTAAIILAVVLLAIVAGGVWLIRRESRKPDEFDYCDVATSEPMPLQGTEIDEAYKQRRHVRAHQPWGAIND